MAAIDFYKLTEEEKRIIFRAVAEREGLPAYAVEKDWWVVQTLKIIFNLDVGKHLFFKGGTSLSKAWGLIDRFSEDIDLVLNRNFLGFKEGLISNSQIRKLRTKSFEFITNTFAKNIQEAFSKVNFDKVSFDFENLGAGDQDPVSLLLKYPAILEHPPYIEPRVKVEIGSRSFNDPNSDRLIKSYIGKQFPGRLYADTEITIPCINPERTFLEKLFLLHEEFQRPEDKIRVNRLSRHLYDVFMISESKFKNIAFDGDIITKTIAHRERFNNMRGVDYKTHFPPYLNPMPPVKHVAAWKADYNKMQEEMIPTNSPSFEEIITKIEQIVLEYNALRL